MPQSCKLRICEWHISSSRRRCCLCLHFALFSRNACALTLPGSCASLRREDVNNITDPMFKPHYKPLRQTLSELALTQVHGMRFTPLKICNRAPMYNAKNAQKEWPTYAEVLNGSADFVWMQSDVWRIRHSYHSSGYKTNLQAFPLGRWPKMMTQNKFRRQRCLWQARAFYSSCLANTCSC